VDKSVRALAAILGIASLAFCAVGCSRVGRAQRGLADPDPVIRAAAAESLGVWRAREAAGAIRPLLRDTSPGVRERAAEALGRLDDMASFKDLLDRILADEDSGVRRATARALGASVPDTAAEVLIPFLDDPRATVRLRVAQALTDLITSSRQRLREPTRLHVGSALGAVVQSGQTDTEELPGNKRGWDAYLGAQIAPEDRGEIVCDQAAIGLGWLGSEAAGRGILLALRGTITPVLRDSLFSVLVITGDTLVTEHLIADCGTGIISSRRRAVRLLGGLPNTHAVETLLRAARDPDLGVRREAWRSLLRVHGLRSSEPGEVIPRHDVLELSPELVRMARRALAEGDPIIFMSAARVLVAAGQADGVRALVEYSHRRPAGLAQVLEILAEAPEGLAGISPEVVRPSVVRGAVSTDPAVRTAAAHALGRWGVPNPASLIPLLLNDRQKDVVVAPLGAVARRRYVDLLADVLPLFGADSIVQVGAARTAASLVDAHGFNYLILALTTDQLQRRRGAVMAVTLAAERVRQTGEGDQYAPLLARAGSWLARMAIEESDPMDRANAVTALGYTPFEDVEETVGLALGDPSEHVRLAAAVAMSRMRPELCVGSLKSLALHGSVEHRDAAVRALVELAAPPAREVLRVVSLVERSPEIRWRARACLASSTGEAT